MLIMLWLTFAVYHNIIKIDNHKLAYDILQHIIHYVLKGCRCISQAKAQYSELVQTLWCSECCFGYILWLQPDLIIGWLQVNTTEHLCTLQLIKQIINAWQWISAFHCLLIQRSVVNAHTQIAILLLDKQHRMTIWAATGLYITLFKQWCNLTIELCHFRSTETIGFAWRRWIIVFQRNGMIHIALWWQFSRQLRWKAVFVFAKQWLQFCINRRWFRLCSIYMMPSFSDIDQVQLIIKLQAALKMHSFDYGA